MKYTDKKYKRKKRELRKLNKRIRERNKTVKEFKEKLKFCIEKNDSIMEEIYMQLGVKIDFDLWKFKLFHKSTFNKTEFKNAINEEDLFTYLSEKEYKLLKK